MTTRKAFINLLALALCYCHLVNMQLPGSRGIVMITRVDQRAYQLHTHALMHLCLTYLIKIQESRYKYRDARFEMHVDTPDMQS